MIKTGETLYRHQIEKYRDYDFGALTVNELELVVHDWYNSKKETVVKFHI